MEPIVIPWQVVERMVMQCLARAGAVDRNVTYRISLRTECDMDGVILDAAVIVERAPSNVISIERARRKR